MNILVVDRLAQSTAPALEALGASVRSVTLGKGASLAALVREHDPEVLVVRSTKVTSEDVAAAKGLSLIIRAGAGVNTIDIAAASSRGIYVANCPGKNAFAVAELTLGHLLNLDRRIADNVASLRAGKWEKATFSGASGLHGRTLALIGTGAIGVEVGKRALAFGMNVVAWSRSLTEARAEELGFTRAESIEAAIAGADAVTLHLALTDDTRGLFDAKRFAELREGAIFINTSRAELVDAAALAEAIETRKLRVGLDVFDAEPSQGKADFSHPLAAHPSFYGTHHIGASTREAEEAVGAEVVRIVRAYANGDPIPNCVNLADDTPATHRLIVRHADRVGVLAHVLTVLGKAGHNVQEMQNIVFSGAEAACARIAVVPGPNEETLRAIVAHEHIFAATVATL